MERELWSYLKTAKKPIVLYGMGNGADKIIAVLEQKGISFQGVFASDGFVKKGKFFHGFPISSYSELKEKFGNMIVLLCFGSERAEVLENVKRIAGEQELYAPEVPVIGSGIFCESYYNEHREEFEEIYKLLADEKSKQTFINTIKYKLSGKIEYLLECEVDKNEPYESFLKLGDNESFLDLGAYNGDTVEDFIKRVDSYKKIIACEPDRKSFKKLISSTEAIKNIECLNVGVTDTPKTADFGMRGGRSSGTSGGDTQIEFLNVDSIINDGITFIKMDVEGEEQRVIRGAEKTILSYKPKMLVSCYHRTEDLITLPKEVFKIRDDYKLYMRHFSSLPAWDTNYYFV